MVMEKEHVDLDFVSGWGKLKWLFIHIARDGKSVVGKYSQK